MLIFLAVTCGTTAALAAVFTAIDTLLARRERFEKERWDKAFGGSGAARSGGRRDV